MFYDFSKDLKTLSRTSANTYFRNAPHKNATAALLETELMEKWRQEKLKF